MTSVVVNKANTTSVQVFRLFLYTQTCLRFRITMAFTVTATQHLEVRARYTFSMPHLICVVELPWGSDFVVDFVKYSDRRSIRLIVSSTLLDGGLKNNVL